MRGLDLSLGAEVQYQGRRFVITNAAIDFDELEAQDPETGRFQRLPISAITVPHDEMVGEVVSDLSSIRGDHYELARRRQTTIERLLAMPKRTRNDVRIAAQELGSSVSALYEWIRLYRMDDRLTTLLPGDKNGGRGQSRLDPAVERQIETALEKYLDPKQLSIKATYREVRRLCLAAKVPIPHENTLRARIRAIPAAKLMRARGHKKAADDMFEPSPGVYDDARKPLDIVQIDHTELDITLVDEEHRLPLKRPWLTVVFDVYSRMVLGFYLSFDSPGALGAGLALARAILPKEKWLARYNIDSKWPCWGRPQSLHADNGREFRGKMLERACAQYRISTIFRPVKNPKFGGHIERSLGTFAKEVHDLPGNARKPEKRGSYDPEAEAVFTLAEFEELLTVYITSIYHRQFHTGISSSPIERWRKAILGDGDTPGCGHFRRPDDEERLYIDFMPIEERTIQNYGVAIDGIQYYSDVLRPYIKASRNGSRRFTFRRDPRDISRIYFWDPDAGEYAEIPYRNVTHPPISVWEVRAIRKNLEEQGRKSIDEDAIFEAYERLREHQETAKAETKRVRKVAERQRLLKRERTHETRPKAAKRGSIVDETRFQVVPPLVVESREIVAPSHFGTIVALEIEEM